jgi:phosphoribosylformylglycinamidine synthase
MVGLIEKPEHVTTQWFKDQGDAIILLGSPMDTGDPLLGLGGSAYLQVVHGLKTGRPPRCDLEREKELDLALRALIWSGAVKSAHDCSEGGLAVALAESCISQQVARETPRLIGAQVDLAAALGAGQTGGACRLDALLFGETQGRIVISVAAVNAAKVLAQAKILEVPAALLGVAGGTTLSIRAPGASFSCDVTELRELWWNSIANVMK